MAPGLELDLRVSSDSVHGTDGDGAAPGEHGYDDAGDALGGRPGGGGDGLSALAGRLSGRGPGLAAMGLLSPALSASPPTSSGVVGAAGEELVADAALLAVDAADAVEIF